MRAVLTRAPIALSLGGSNVGPGARPCGDRSIGAAIDRYAIVAIRKGTPGKVHISLHEHCPESAFALVDDAVARFGQSGLRRSGVDIDISAPSDCGAPVSSAIAVALVGAISTYLDLDCSRDTIAWEAERLHARSLYWSGGWEYCSTYGGMHLVRRDEGETATDELCLMPGLADTLNRRLLLFSSSGRVSSTTDGAWDTPQCMKALHNLRAIAQDMQSALQEANLELFGKLLDSGWSHERSLPGLPLGSRIDAGYRAAVDAGALGGRAVSPTMLLLYASKIAQEGIEQTMTALGWHRVPFGFDREGIHSSPDGVDSPPVWSVVGRTIDTERDVRHSAQIRTQTSI